MKIEENNLLIVLTRGDKIYNNQIKIVVIYMLKIKW